MPAVRVAGGRRSWKSTTLQHREDGLPCQASLFYLPSIASRAEIEQGMAGMRGDSISAC